MQPYIPDDLPLKDIDFQRLFRLAAEANAEVARFDGLLQGMVNSELLLSPLLTDEAVKSSRIEGTQATLNDVFEWEAGVKKSEHIQNDVQEIINYRDAMIFAEEYLKNRPISLGFIRQLHQRLMKSVRGTDKSPGQFRETQNYIGPIGCSVDEATFVPPSPVRLTTDLEAFERYLNEDDVEILLQTAVVHAQFELIHPFNDGNGRIGRLLIPLFLHQKKKLFRPTFYISNYLETNRDTYYERLRAISRHGDWNGWIEFFLRAVIYEAKNDSQKVRSIILLYEKMKQEILRILHSQFSVQVLDFLFHHPYFRANVFTEMEQVNPNICKSILRKLKNEHIIKEVVSRSGSSPAHLIFPELFKIIEK